MERFIRIVLAVLVSAVCLCSCGRDGKVIPRSKLSRIYAEMFLADAWLNTAPMDARERADTMAFYEPIFEKYGYTVEDYWASVSYYLQDPDRFSRILNKSNVMLETEFNALEKQRQAAFDAASNSGTRIKPKLFHPVYGVNGAPIDPGAPALVKANPKRLEDRPL